MKELIICNLVFGILPILSTQLCRSLVLSGGANKGAYEAGALYEWAHNSSDILESEDIQYDVVSGISVGALNSIGVSLYKKGDEKNMTSFLYNLWQQVNTSNIYQSWPGPLYGLLHGLFYEKGVVDDSPIYDLLQQIYYSSPNIQRKIVVAAIDTISGQFVEFTEQIQPPEDIIQAVFGSVSMPIFFPFREVQGYQLIDAGSIWNQNLVSAVHRCLEIVDNQNEIIMDVINLDNVNLTKINNTGKTFNNFMRYMDIRGYYKKMTGIYEVMRQFPLVQYRYLVTPEEQLAKGLQILFFNNQTLFPMIQQGRHDGRNVALKGPGYYFQEFNQWYQNIFIQQDYLKDFSQYLSDKK